LVFVCIAPPEILLDDFVYSFELGNSKPDLFLL